MGVVWVPLPPTPKGNHGRIVKFGGRLAVVPARSAEKAARALVTLLRPHAPSSPLSGPVWRDAVYVLPAPAKPAAVRRAALAGVYLPFGTGKGGRQPDVGNLDKLLDDCLEAAGFVHVDGQIVGGVTQKAFGAVPGYLLRVVPLSQGVPAWQQAAALPAFPPPGWLPPAQPTP